MAYCGYGPWSRAGLGMAGEVTVDAGLRGQGLVHLHGLGIIHGDLKPGNVLLDDHGRPLISDWGFSRVSHGFTRTRAAATSIGFTDDYAAPEVLDGQRTSAASDMYVLVLPLAALPPASQM